MKNTTTCADTQLPPELNGQEYIAEQQLIKSEEKYRTLIEQAFDGIIIYSRNGTILDFNDSAAAYMRYPKEEFKLLKIQQLFFSEDLLIKPLGLESLSAGQSIMDLRRLKRSDGSSIEMEISTKKLADGTLMAIARDITERKEAAQLLLKAYKENTTILESIMDGFLTVDKNWIITYWNKEAERMLGMAREKIIGKNIWDVYAIAIPLKFYSETHKALALQVPVNFEEFFSPLGIWIDVSAYPSGDGLSIYFKNITEKRLAAEKIKEAKERYEMLASVTNDAIYEWDIVAGTSLWNEGYETLFGHKRTGDIMPAASWVCNLHPDEKEKLFADVADAFEKKLTSLTREMRFRCADGSYKTVFDKLVIQYDDNLKPARIFGAMQDITESKRNETAIRELNEQLNKRAEELIASNAELERFAYVASHDLQEPLRMISSFLQLLQKKYKSQLDETAEQYIAYAVEGASRMKSLILDLLEFSRIGSNKDVFAALDMNEVVSQVMETFSTKIQETGAVIKVQLMPVVKASGMQMTQLIQNLLSNSFKYNTRAVPEIEIGCEDKGDSWQFFVKDNGIGIEEKFFAKIFVIFQRLHNKNQFSGTGIGLAICKKIIERHGGRIWIESRMGEGSTFFFTLSK
jgi:PAS domain S-box-containing protein